MKYLLEKGDWGHSLYECWIEPDTEFSGLKNLVTGCFCVCINEGEKLVLANKQPLGGHLEHGETFEECLKREALEEGGVELTTWKYFGYYKITQKDSCEQYFKDKYPKEGYLLFFLAKGKQVREPFGSDVKSSETMAISDVLNSEEITHKMLKEGLKLFPGYFE